MQIMNLQRAMLKFLYLPDIHFIVEDAGKQFDRDDEITDRQLNNLGQDGRTDFDSLLVTGGVDITAGKKNSTEQAFGLRPSARNKQPSESLFLVPGNHDVNQGHVKMASVMWDAHRTLLSERVESVRDEEKLNDAS